MSQLEIPEVVASTHLKSPLDLAVEESVKLANSLHKQIKKNIADGKDVTGKELAFRMKEHARLSNMATLQERLDVYRENAKSMTKNEKEKDALKSNTSSILGDHLIAAGKFKPNIYWQAHHIICAKHASHAFSRSILFSDRLGYGINDPDNGCWLPQKHKYALSTHRPKAVGHAYIHTKRYATFVAAMIAPVKTRLELQGKLKIIEVKLQNAATALDQSVLTQNGRNDLRSST